MSTHQISRRRNTGLWIAQILLAALFLFAGGFKLVAPASQLAQQSPVFAPAFLKFIGACEVLGALGLVLPGWFGVHRALTPLAACGLVIIMIGAVVSTIATMPASMAILPAIAGVIAFTIARGRWSALQIAARPSPFRIERSVVIAAPAYVVFSHLDDFHRWSAWSPYERLDPGAMKIYSGAPSGVGAAFHYRGRKTGEGRMRITRMRPNELVVVQADFIKPFAATNQIEFTLQPSAGGVTVTWAMTGYNGFVFKAFSLVVNVDRMVGTEFERGLSDLKRVSEYDAVSLAAIS